MALAFLPGISSAQTLPSYLPAEGLVAWYPFNGNANDESGNGNHGSNSGGVFTTNREGLTNSAVYFSSAGCGTRVDADINTSSIESGLTIAIWLKRDGAGCIGPRIFEFWPGFDGTGMAQWGWDNQTQVISVGSHTSTGFGCYSAIPIAPVGEWLHLAYTNDGAEGKFYRNGVLFEAVPSEGNPVLAGDVAFGRMNHPAWDAFNGTLDDIGVWNRALTEVEVAAMFLGTPPIYGCTDPSACNFNHEANSEDGSCLPAGCTNPEACNFNAGAFCDDGSCAPIGGLVGCMDPAACNFSPVAGCPDTCDYSCVCTAFDWVRAGDAITIRGVAAALDGGLIVKTNADVFHLDNITSDWSSMGFDQETSISGGISELTGYNSNGELFTGTDWDCFYKRDASGSWISMGMCGFGTGGHWWTIGDAGRIFMTKGGFLRNIYKSDDDGHSWQALNTGYEDWHHLFRAENGDLFAAGGGLGVIRLQNNGDSHSLVTSNFPIQVNSTSCVHGTSNAVYASVNNNQLFSSQDWGESWNLNTTAPYGQTIVSFRFFTDLDALIFTSGEGGVQLHHYNIVSNQWVNTELPQVGMGWLIPYVIDDLLLLATPSGLYYSSGCMVHGCTDENACNFNPDANSNDGSCIPAGCMNSAVCNYNPDAGCDDGSCAGIGDTVGCMDQTACNFEPMAVCIGPCIYQLDGLSDCQAGGALCGQGMTWDVTSQTCVIDPTYIEDVIEEAFANWVGEVCGPGTFWDAESGTCQSVQSGCPEASCPSDLSGDGITGTEDLLMLLSTFGFDCPESVCTEGSLESYDVSAPLASFYLNFTGPSSYNAGPRPAGAYALRVSGTFCVGSCWNGHTVDAAYWFNDSQTPGILPWQDVVFMINEYCPQGNLSCEARRPSPDLYNPEHVYTYYFDHPGGDLVVYGIADECCWWDNQGGLSFELFGCSGN
jgi:hypothetical protein